MVSGDAGATWTPLLGAAGVRQTEGGPSGPLWWLSTNQLATLGGPNYLTTQIALDPTSAAGGCTRQRILVAGRAGVFGSTDAGASWYPMMRGLGLTVIRGVVSDPNDPSRVYVAPADWAFASSTDGGASMTRSAPAQVFDAFGVAVDPSTSPSTVVLATGQFSSNTGEIWSNPDPASGGTWTSEGFAAAGGTRPTGVAVNRVGGQPVILAMAQSSGIWRKAAGVWSRVNTSVGGGGQPSFSWLPGSMVVFFYDDTTGVWRSNDAGQTWSRIWNQPSLADMTGFVAADPTAPSRLYVSVGGVGLYRLEGADVGTVDGGIVAQPIGTLTAPGAIAVRSDGAIVAVELPGPGDGPAVVVSTDLGATWSTISDPGYAATGGFVRVLASGADASVWAGLFGDGLSMRPQPSFDLTVATSGRGGPRHVRAGRDGLSADMRERRRLGRSRDAHGDAGCRFHVRGLVGERLHGDGNVSGDIDAVTFGHRHVRVSISTRTRRWRWVAARSSAMACTARRGWVRRRPPRRRNHAPSRSGCVCRTTARRRTRSRSRGPGDSTGFRLRYLMGSTDVTAQVRAGTFRTASLAPGNSVTLTLTVTTVSGSKGRTQGRPHQGDVRRAGNADRRRARQGHGSLARRGVTNLRATRSPRPSRGPA